MNMKNRKKNFILTFSVIILFCISSAFAQENPTKNILILNSYQKGFLWTDNIVKGIESVLEPEKNNIGLKTEYMDTKEIGYKTEYKERLVDLYKYKYGNKKFDLIISTDDNALNFLREYHKDLFPGIPILFCGVNNFDIPDMIDREVFTGIIELQSVKETIDLALKLHPETGQIIFVVENSPTGIYLWNQIQGLLKYYEDIRITRIDDSFSMEQIEDKVSELPDDAIVFWGTLHSDKSEKYYSYGDGALRVSKASSRPMYGHTVEILPYGIVGGKLFGGFYHGQVTAKMAQRILKGEKVRDIPVLTEPQTQYMFNYEQLELWDIDTSNLPEESIIINKPSSFYEENKILIWSIIAFVALQMLIIISLIMNVAKRRKAEKEILKLSKTVEDAPVAIVICDLEGKIEYVNSGLLDLGGFDDDSEIIGQSFLKFTDEAGVKMLQQDVIPILLTGKSYKYESPVKRKDGSIFPAEIISFIIQDENKQPKYMIGYFTDITERKQSEEKIKAKNLFLEGLIHQSPLPTFVMDSKGFVLMVNEAFLKFYAVPNKDLILGTNALTEPANIKQDVVKYFKEALSGKIVEIPELEFISPHSNKKVIMRCRMFPISDTAGKLTNVVVMQENITEQKEAEAKLKKYRENLEELVKERTDKLEKSQQSLTYLVEDVNESRAELDISNIKLATSNKELEAFSYSVSHDLRAPLRHIDGFTKLLNNKIKNKIDEQAQNYFDKIINSSKQMNQLIDDLLIFSRTSRKDVKKININMKAVVDEAMQTFDSDIKENNISVIVDDMPDVNLDVSLIMQAWANLISNAVKFTGKKEKPEIHIGTDKDTEGNNIFFIKDNGVGFDQKYVDKLFGVFQRLHNINEFPGTGIGLANVKRIITKHGGDIRAEGEINKGASFFFTLPKADKPEGKNSHRFTD